MKTQQVSAVVPRHTRIAASALPPVKELDSGYFVHPYLTTDDDPVKGRLVRASSSIPAGTVLLRDTPYATVPIPTSTDDTFSIICSNISCSKRTDIKSYTVRCPRSCDSDVIWCSSKCRSSDYKRHEFECGWLKNQGKKCRQKELPYDFITLWHVVRLLASWSLELQPGIPSVKCHRDRRFSGGWEAVVKCCDYLEAWPDAQLTHWKRLAEAYMMDKTLLPCVLSLGDMVSLICKEETNTFGLYPMVTGPHSVIGHRLSRGELYGLSLYPRAAMFNHSCDPIAAHKPDSSGHMIFTATREITAGEEITITYFDLAAHEGVARRQKYLLEQFRFKCTCDQCLRDKAAENLAEINALPFGDL